MSETEGWLCKVRSIYVEMRDLKPVLKRFKIHIGGELQEYTFLYFATSNYDVLSFIACTCVIEF